MRGGNGVPSTSLRASSCSRRRRSSAGYGAIGSNLECGGLGVDAADAGEAGEGVGARGDELAARVATMRAPEAPRGWPIAMAPHLVLTISGSIFQASMHANGWTLQLSSRQVLRRFWGGCCQESAQRLER